MKNIKLVVYLITLYTIAAACYYLAYQSHIKNYYQNISKMNIQGFIFFTILSIITESFIINYKETGISPVFAVTLASTLYFGVFWGMVIASLGTAFRYFKVNNKPLHILNTPFYKTLFNISTCSIGIFVGGTLFFSTFNEPTLNPLYLFLRLLLFVLIYLIINISIISILISIISNNNFIDSVKNYFRIGFLSIVFVSPFGIIIYILYSGNGNIIGIILLMIIIFLIRYIFKLYFQD